MKVVNVNVSNTYLDALKRLLDEINLYGDSLQEKCVLIVPDNFSLNAEKLFFEHLEKEATFNVEFLTFSRLANSILKEQNISVNLINKTTGILLLTKIIYENKNELKLFGKMGLKNGIVEELYNTINQFKSSYISPEEIVVKDDNSLLSQKLHDIKFLYTQFELQLLNFGLDGSTRLNLFCKEIPNSNTIKNTRYFFGFFQSFTYQQQMVLVNLIKHAKSVSFGVSATTFQENSKIYLNENLQRVLNVCKEAGVKANIQNYLSDLTPAINHIVKNAYSYNNKKFALDGRENIETTALPLFSVNEGRTQNNLFKNEIQAEEKSLITQIGLIEASDTKDEVEFVAKQIKSDLYFKGLENKNIQVAVCDLQTYAPIIEEVFTKFGFDFYISKNESLNNSFLVRDIQNLFDLIANSFERKNYISFLKSPLTVNYFSFCILNAYNNRIIGSQNDDITLFSQLKTLENNQTNKLDFVKKYYLDIVQKLENYMLKFGINFNSIFCALNLEKENKNLTEFELVKNITTPIILNFVENLKNCNYAKDYSEALLNFLSEINCEQTIQEVSKEFELNKDFVHEKTSEKSYKNLIQLLESIKQVFEGNSLTLTDFVNVLFNAINNLNLSVLPVGANQIYIAEANSNSFLKVDNLYIMGAEINTFPNFKQDIGVLCDTDIASLNCKKNLEPTIREINRKEKYTCFELLSLFNKKLIISYPLQKNGASLVKSEIFNMLSNMFTINNKPLSIIKTSNILSSIFQIQNPERKNILMATYLGNKNTLIKLKNNTVIKKIYNKIYENNNFVKKFENQKYIQEGKALFFGEKNKSSVSRIETFYACPYKHFLQYGIGLKEREIFDIKPLDIGNVMHKVVEIFVKKLIAFKMRVSKDNFEEFVEDIFENVCSFDEFKKLNSKDYIFIKKSLFQESVRLCNAIYYSLKNSAFKPESSNDVEKSFSYAINSVNIDGKIDRIDSYENMFRLIDYKTGKSDFSFKEIYYGNKLQLMLYALAISEMLNKQVAGVFYLPVKNGYNQFGKDVLSMYKMSGTYLNNLDILKLFDKTVNLDNPQSKIVKGKIKLDKGGDEVLDTYTQNACLEPHEFNNLLTYAKQMFISACENLKEGYIEKNPCERNGANYCKTCPYNSVCGYNESRPFRNQNKTINKDSFVLGENDV